MNNLIIKQSQLVTATITGAPSAARRYNFNDIPNLSRNNIILYGIEAFSADQLANIPSGEDVLAANVIDQVVVTLKDNNNVEFVYQMPYFSLVRSLNGGFVVMLKPRIINLTDCYIQLTDAAGVNAGEVAAFNFYYDIV
jgi:hypothetical protein